MARGGVFFRGASTTAPELTDAGTAGHVLTSNGADADPTFQAAPGAGPGSGDVVGPAAATDNAIARYDGITGKLIQNSGITVADGATGALSGTNSGDVTLAGLSYLSLAAQVITAALINLTSHVTGRLPFANVATIATQRLLGRSTASSGDVEEIAIGSGLSLAAGVLSATGNTSWVPLAVGTEPLAFVSDGNGNPILISYTP